MAASIEKAPSLYSISGSFSSNVESFWGCVENMGWIFGIAGAELIVANSTDVKAKDKGD